MILLFHTIDPSAFRMWIARFDAIEAASKQENEIEEREERGRIRSAATLIFTQ